MRPGTADWISDTGYAKINLALHVRGRRDDGYHELETCFAFCDFGDSLAIRPAEKFRSDGGALFGGAMGPDEDNLVIRALRQLHGGALPNLAVELGKMLPVAAGLGGGSADAAAIFRMLGAEDRIDLAATLGADVPACIASQPVIGRGVGTELEPVVNDVAGLAVVLVNPMKPLPTGPVFKGWNGLDLGPMPPGSAREILMQGRNDLEAPATTLCPEIAEILAFLTKTGPLVARMSGSGASCFAIYEDYDHAADISFRLREFDRPDWWSWEGRLR